jgi:hypothetical protein
VLFDAPVFLPRHSHEHLPAGYPVYASIDSLEHALRFLVSLYYPSATGNGFESICVCIELSEREREREEERERAREELHNSERAQNQNRHLAHPRARTRSVQKVTMAAQVAECQRLRTEDTDKDIDADENKHVFLNRMRAKVFSAHALVPLRLGYASEYTSPQFSGLTLVAALHSSRCRRGEKEVHVMKGEGLTLTRAYTSHILTPTYTDRLGRRVRPSLAFRLRYPCQGTFLLLLLLLLPPLYTTHTLTLTLTLTLALG